MSVFATNGPPSTTSDGAPPDSQTSRFGPLLYRGRNSRIYRGLGDSATVLKVLNKRFPTERQIEAFYNEFDLLSNLSCPGLRRAYEKRRDHDEHVLVLEYVEGKPLRSLMREPPDVERLLRAAASTARTLGELHGHGIVHKDITSDNILWCERDQRTCMIDFGLSARIETNVQYVRNPDCLEGTLAYISPEQTGRLHRVVDYRSDLYSFGAVLYELFTGRLPFEQTDALELIYAHIAKPCRPACERNDRVPVMISRIIAKLMMKNPEDRYQSATGVCHDLEHCITQWQAAKRIDEFALASHDVPARLNIPQALYGRDREIADLLHSVDRMTEGSSEFVLIAGYSGVGKTSLIKEIQKQVTTRRTFFISGKFDQLQRGVPYSAFIQAMAELVSDLLADTEDQLVVWRQRLRSAVGELGQVLLDLVPSLHLVIGPQPAVDELDPARAQNRFNLVIGRFIRTMSQADHPLVLFLDDLQWADVASLTLLEAILGDEDIAHFMVLGAYRDNEVDELHPLTRLRRTLAQRDATRVHEIVLSNLSVDHVNQLVADALRGELTAVRPLAAIIHDKTHGNAFFVGRFLQSLAEEQLIRFSVQDNRWVWDIEDIERRNITDNVVELLVGKMQGASAEAQNVLRLAACIGSRFRLSTLAVVAERTTREVLEALWEPIRSGFVVPLDEQYKLVPHLERDSEFRFLHDRVQQAAYALVDAQEHNSIHLAIGRLLLQGSSDGQLETNLFQIVSHLNHGHELIVDRGERLRLAALDLRAGVKAKHSAAYDSAASLLHVGVALLPDEAWTTAYQLTFELYIELAECVFLTGQFPAATELLDVALRHSRTDAEKARAYLQKIAQHTIHGMYLEAIRIGIHAFEEVGIRLPSIEDRSDTTAYVARVQAAFRERWGDRPIEALYDLPVTDDALQELLRAILLNLADCSLIAAPHYLPVLGLTAINMSVEHGNSSNSAYGYLIHGINLAAIDHDYRAAFDFGMVGLRLSQDKFRDLRVTCKVLNGIGGFLYFYRMDMAETIELMERGYLAGIEGGDFVHSSYCLVNSHRNLISSGAPLARVAEKAVAYLAKCKKLNAMVIHELLQGSSGAFLQYMTGKSISERTFDSAEFSVSDFLEKYKAVRLFAAFSGIYQILGFYLMRQGDLALAAVEVFEADLPFADNYVHGEEYRFLAALVLLRGYAELPALAKPACWQRIRDYHAFVSKVAEAAPTNFRAHELLLAAEMARVEGRWEACALYDEAIAATASANQLHYRAMANECAGRFWLEHGKPDFARLHLVQAHYGYVQWGASRKVQALEGEFAQFFDKPALTSDASHATMTVTGVSSLDTESLVRVLQAISQEVHLDALLATVMKVVMQSAGAERASLVLPGAEGLRIAAYANSSDGVRVQSSAVENTTSLCTQVVQYVGRAKDTIIVDNATAHPEYATLPYIRDNRVLSLLCLPLLLHGELSGILYLENNLTTNAFTRGRVELLTHMAAQIADALQNAKFYEELEDRVAERTRDLQVAQQRLVEVAYHDGMAEIAIEVLHNVGNVLNSVHTSAHCILEQATSPRAAQFVAVHAKFRDKVATLGLDDSMRQFFDYYALLGNVVAEEAKVIREEAVCLTGNVDKISQIVAYQQRYVRSANPTEAAELGQLLDEVIAAEAHANSEAGIEVTNEYRGEVRVRVYKQKLIEILRGVFENAREALIEVPRGARTLHVVVRADESGARIELRDTGSGIAKEHLQQVFGLAFTTRPGKHGFGLHTCANYMTGIGGAIVALSEGKGAGATFVLTFPANDDAPRLLAAAPATRA